MMRFIVHRSSLGLVKVAGPVADERRCRVVMGAWEKWYSIYTVGGDRRDRPTARRISGVTVEVSRRYGRTIGVRGRAHQRMSPYGYLVMWSSEAIAGIAYACLVWRAGRRPPLRPQRSQSIHVSVGVYQRPQAGGKPAPETDCSTVTPVGPRPATTSNVPFRRQKARCRLASGFLGGRITDPPLQYL